MVRQVETLVHGRRWHAETIPIVLPMSHIYGLGLVCGAIFAGDTLIIHSKVDFKVFQSIATYKAQSLYAVSRLRFSCDERPRRIESPESCDLPFLGACYGRCDCRHAILVQDVGHVFS